MKTVNISKMCVSYEACCQKMLLNGLKFLNEHQDFDFRVYKEFRGVYGLCMGEGEAAEALDKAVCEGVKPTGAMHYTVIWHLAYIHKNGYDAWLAEAEKQGKSLYERPEEEDLDKTILIDQIEWQLKLDGGYNPLAEIQKIVPMDDWITIDPDNPDSIKKAAEETARRMRHLQRANQ